MRAGRALAIYLPPVPPTLYFAYGSNMSSSRLRVRVPSARPVGAARLHDWRFACNKLGADGSGKANVVPSPGALVWGVAFEVEPVAFAVLDRFEPGYRRIGVSLLHVAASRELTAQVYVADPHGAELPPTPEYREHLLTGAREFALPGDVHEALAGLPATGVLRGGLKRR